MGCARHFRSKQSAIPGGLKACGAGLEIASADDFRRYMQGFVDEPSLAGELGEKAGAFVQQMTGATEKILSDVHF